MKRSETESALVLLLMDVLVIGNVLIFWRNERYKR